MLDSIRLALSIAPALAAASAVAAQPDTLTASGVRAVIACRDGLAWVRGSGNTVTVDGRCTGLQVTGSDNLITADVAAGGVITLDGDRNRVVYPGPVAPQAVTHGFYDQVIPANPVAAVGGAPAAPVSTLVLDPGSPSFDVSCRNLDVVIRGDLQHYVLRGGCRSLTVQGRLDTVTAELLPGAPVLIGGPGVLLNYVLTGQGPAPVVRVTAPGLKAEQIQHYDNSQLSLPTGR
jgi:hypothetical protein